MAFINFKSKLNAINLAHTIKLSLKVQKLEINKQKIDIFFHKIYNIVIAHF